MPRRRRRIRPRTDIPDWRDPAMPVLRDYEMADGSKRKVVDEDYERRYREHLMSLPPEQNRPLRKDDPTYALKKQRKKL